MLSIRKIYVTLFLIGWFFFPFNDFEGFEPLGEFKNEAGAYFFLAGFVFFGIESFYRGKISIPYNSKIFKVLMLFLLWCIVTIALNFTSVSESYFKHTSGVYRFIRQFVSLLISTFFFLLYFWNVVARWSVSDILFKIRRVLLYCMIFAFSYGVLETAIVYFNVGAARPILDLFDYFPFLDVNFPPGGRISSIAYESPSLGNYLIAVSGWMFSYILTEKGNPYKFLPTLMVLFLTFFSGSRTAMVTVGLQAAILFGIMYAMPQYRRTVTVGFGYIAIVAALMLALNGNNIVRSVDEKIKTLNFSQNLKKNVSNQSRFGMQYASLQVFKEHPIVGVGFGQEAYYTRFHYPGWAKKDNWEFKLMYLNKNFKSFPTAYNLYTRLLAETGIIGVLIWCFMIYLCIKNAINIFKRSVGDRKWLGFILIVSFVGMSVNWLQTDFFRQYAFWLCFVILLRLLDATQEPKTKLATHETA